MEPKTKTKTGRTLTLTALVLILVCAAVATTSTAAADQDSFFNAGNAEGVGTVIDHDVFNTEEEGAAVEIKAMTDRERVFWLYRLFFGWW